MGEASQNQNEIRFIMTPQWAQHDGIGEWLHTIRMWLPLNYCSDLIRSKTDFLALRLYLIGLIFSTRETIFLFQLEDNMIKDNTFHLISTRSMM